MAKYDQEKARFVTKVGPRKSIQMLECLAQDHNARLRWMALARVDAIVGGCAKSLDSVKSGIRCFEAFASKVVKKVGGGSPSDQAIRDLRTTFDSDPHWHPGKAEEVAQKPGPKPKFTEQNARARACAHVSEASRQNRRRVENQLALEPV